MLALPTSVDLLEGTAPSRLADWLASTAASLTGGSIALYVIDIGGSWLQRVAGDGSLPERLPMSQGVGPELPERSAAELVTALGRQGLHATPLWLAHRATAVLISDRTPAPGIAVLAREMAAAIDMADRFTDIFESARRPKSTSPAAELQEMLLPPRLARVPGGEIAAAVVPAYEVGGDWFDYATGRDRVSFAVSDAVGKGSGAMALSALVLGALRSVRRQQCSLGEQAAAMHEAVIAMGRPDEFVTAVLAEWDYSTRVLSWIGCGHPRPLVFSADGGFRELGGPTGPPLGVAGDGTPPCLEEQLSPGERVLLYSDGIAEYRLADGSFMGVEGIADAATAARDGSAAAMAIALIEALGGGDSDLDDDATLLVLSVG